MACPASTPCVPNARHDILAVSLEGVVGQVLQRLCAEFRAGPAAAGDGRAARQPLRFAALPGGTLELLDFAFAGEGELDRAAELFDSGLTRVATASGRVAWRVRSSAARWTAAERANFDTRTSGIHEGGCYVVVAGHCSCADFRRRVGAGDHLFCKHVLAVALADAMTPPPPPLPPAEGAATGGKPGTRLAGSAVGGQLDAGGMTAELSAAVRAMSEGRAVDAGQGGAGAAAAGPRLHRPAQPPYRQLLVTDDEMAALLAAL